VAEFLSFSSSDFARHSKKMQLLMRECVVLLEKTYHEASAREER
jgi:hypothetical protein